MKYSQPEITTLAPALQAVQSMNVKVLEAHGDGDDAYITTPGAYEADE